MKDRDLLVPWVERVLMEVLEEDHVHHDNDGDYPIRLENTVAYIRVDSDPANNVRVQVFAAILGDVPASPELYEKLNGLNLELSYFRFRFRDGVIDAVTEVVGEACRTEHLRTVLSALDVYAGDLPHLLGLPEAMTWKKFAGRSGTPLAEDEPGSADEEAEDESDTATEDGPAVASADADETPIRRITAKPKRRAGSASKGGTKSKGKGTKDPDPDEHPPPGYL